MTYTTADPLSVECPVCAALRGCACIVWHPEGDDFRHPHSERETLAKRVAAETEVGRLRSRLTKLEAVREAAGTFVQYALHPSNCPAYHAGMFGGDPCECGKDALEAALSACEGGE